MRHSSRDDKTIVWTAVVLISLGAVIAGWFGFIWPYYVVFVIAVYLFQLWYFRDSLRGKLSGSRLR